jgi:hypothetical protein
VQASGIARASYAGQRATVEALVGSRRIGAPVVATIARDGSFAATLALPSRSRRGAVKYRAVIAGKLSDTLRLERKLRIAAARTPAGGTRVSGRITEGSGRRTVTLIVKACTGSAPFLATRSARDGRFRIDIPPVSVAGAIVFYRLRAALADHKTYSVFIVQRGTGR